MTTIEAMNATWTTAPAFSWALESSSDFDAVAFTNSERCRMLDRKQQYFDCTQHDGKLFDFDGRPYPAGKQILTQQMLPVERAPWFVPLAARRPSTPYRGVLSMISAFTNMAFGRDRFPRFSVAADIDGQKFVDAVVEVTKLAVVMIQARDLGGAVGTIGLSWSIIAGVPVIEVHNGKHLHVHEWVDRARHVPKHVSEVYTYEKDIPENGKMVRRTFWHRRDWTLDADIAFEDVEAKGGRIRWVISEENSVVHEEGKCRLRWVQNRPSDQIDGPSDADGVYENADDLDVLFSVLMRGGKLNLDPTVVLKAEDEYVESILRKGSDQALNVGPGGDAKYMELTGQSILAGLQLFEKARSTMLEVAQCVIADPDKIVAAGTSSLALRMIFAPMTARSDILRGQYILPVVEIIADIRSYAQRLAVKSTPVEEAQIESDPFTSDTEESSEVSASPEEGEAAVSEGSDVVDVLLLPPRIEVIERFDEEGNLEGQDIVEVDQKPGVSGRIKPIFGPYFRPTLDEKAKAVQTMNTATLGKALLDRLTAVEQLVADAFPELDPSVIVERLMAQEKADEARRASAFGGNPGDMVGSEDELPDGALPSA